MYMIVQNGEKKFGLLALKCKDDCIITTQDGRVAPEAKIKQQKGMLGLDETGCNIWDKQKYGNL